MDSMKFFIGDVQNLSRKNLRPTYQHFARGEKLLLYRSDNPTDRDWHLAVYVKQVYGKTNLTIYGSIRKWYYGKYTFRNLTKEDYEACLDLIAERLGLSENEIWDAKIVKGEISLSLILKPDMAYFLHSFVDYKGFDVMRYSHTSLSFIGESKTLKFYNAGRLIWKKLGFSKKKIARIESYFLRYRVEVKIDDLLRIENRMSEMLSNPGTVLKNWNEVYSFLRKYIADVECYGTPSEVRNKLKGGSRKDYIEHLTCLGIVYNTPQRCFEELKLLKPGKPRFEAKRKLREILENAGTATTDKQRFLDAYDRKAEQICHS